MTAGSDAIIAKMKEYGGPITRERYIAFRFFGAAPDELSAEEESEIPDYPWDDDDAGVPDGDDRGAGAAGG